MSRFSRWIFWTALLYLVASAYLASSGDPSLAYFTALSFHVFGGIILLVPLVVYAARALRRLDDAGGLPGRFALGVLLLTLGTGVAILFVGGGSSTYGLVLVHIGAAVAAVIVWLDLARRLARGEFAPVAARWAWKAGRALVPLLVVWALAGQAFDRFGSHEWDRVTNPLRPPARMEEEGGGPKGPFFPSSATTVNDVLVESDFFMNSPTCQDAGCHPDIFEQWNESAHHFSSFNNQWYRKSVVYMQEVVGTRPSKWCGGCHDMALLLAGKMDTPVVEQMHAPESQAGMGCVTCHSIVEVKDTMGQGGYRLRYPPLHKLAASENPMVKWMHDFMVKLDPEPHRRTFMPPVMRADRSEFCSTCHKVHLDAPVNSYRWLRGFDEYDAWQGSGVGLQGARSFYYPPEAQKCGDCHMPLVKSDDAGNVDGYVHSHRFPAANTALPYVNRHPEQLQVVQNFLKDDKVTVDLFAVSEAGEKELEEEGPVARADVEQQMKEVSFFAAEGELGQASGRGAAFTSVREVVAPLDRSPVVLERGKTYRVDVVVRTRGVGHFFPGGTVDAFDVWVELRGMDSNGRPVFWSGYVEEGGEGPVDPSAHFYRSFMLDAHGNEINKRNAWAARTALYVRLIPPGAADVVHFRVHVPEDCGEEITFETRLNYRKFSRYNTEFAFAGRRDPDNPPETLSPHHDDGRWSFDRVDPEVAGKVHAIPDIPITVMDEKKVTLVVADEAAPLETYRADPVLEDYERWNDFGIGLLLQGDLKGAQEAFTRVTEIAPEYADGWVNRARVHVKEGDMEAAQEMLDRALVLDGKMARAHYFYGLAEKAFGRYDSALGHFRVAAGQHPRDRVVRNQIGRILFLQRRYQEAVAEFRKTLEVDPEDLTAHYNLYLCFRGLDRPDEAAKERVYYDRFKLDEDNLSITGIARRADEHANQERQAIHEHDSFFDPEVSLSAVTGSREPWNREAEVAGGDAGGTLDESGAADESGSASDD
jgi:Tfp pilus assembly protein PilF